MKSLSHVLLFATPRTVAHQALPPMDFSRQEYWDNSEAYFKPGVSKLVKLLGFVGHTVLVLRLKSAFAVQKQPRTMLNE